MLKHFTKSRHVWKRCYLYSIVDRLNIIKAFLLKEILLALGGVFITLTQNSFRKFQLHIIKEFRDNFSSIVFLFALAQKVRLLF